MSQRALSRVLSVLWLCLCVGACSNELRQPTETIIELDAEPEIRAQLVSLSVVVRGGAPGAMREVRYGGSPLKQPKLPLHIALVPLDGDDGRTYDVSVIAYGARGGFVAA